jgi:hypothetical protein
MNNIIIKTYQEVVPINNLFFVQAIKRYIVAGNPQINQLGTAKIYRLTPTTVVKQIELCRVRTSTLCRLVKTNNLVYEYSSLIGAQDIIQILAPDFIIEILIMEKMRKLMIDNCIFGSVEIKNHGLDLTDINPSVYIEMEYLNNNLGFTNTSDEKFIAFNLFMVMSNLVLMQHYMRFTHYDLHWGNIMKKNITRGAANCMKYLDLDKIWGFNVTEWLVIGDFGTSIFSEMEGQIRKQYINITNNNRARKSWTEFNQYFDGLTILKATELLFQQGWNIQTNIPNIIDCFVKPGFQIDSYFDSMQRVSYKPNIYSISTAPHGLYTPHDVMLNLYNNILRNSRYNNIFIECPKLVVGEIIGTGTTCTPVPILPILRQQDIFDFPFVITPTRDYFMDYKNGAPLQNIQCSVIREIHMQRIFSFSLCIKPDYFRQIMKIFYDSTYQLCPYNTDSCYGQFYYKYVMRQINDCISLIMNTEITPASPGDGIDQWNDFGVLNFVDKRVLDLPMLLLSTTSPNICIPWNKNTNIPDENFITEAGRTESQNYMDANNANPDHFTDFLNAKEYGTIRDYFIYRLNTDLPDNQKHRYGLYEYSLPPHLTKQININGVIHNYSTGLLGSIVRFFALQDPRFEIVLFRDAHSTLPNRNYIYDRGWFNTWLTQNKKYWIYHGAFYNPPHFSGVKSGFAAAWGCRRSNDSLSIFTPGKYGEIFGFTNEDDDLFYKQTTYGVDERLLYRLYKDPNLVRDSYLVGIAHFIYLFKGQENPRNYKILKEQGIGDPGVYVGGDETQLEVNKFSQGNLQNKKIISEIYISQNLQQKIVGAGCQIIYTGALPDIYQKGIVGMIVQNLDEPQNLKNPTRIAAEARGIKIFDQITAEQYFFKEEPWICRPFGFFMFSNAFYTDLKCICIETAKVASVINNVTLRTITMGQFFNYLEANLARNANVNGISPGDYFMLHLQQMLPPRWNIWDYLFNMKDTDSQLFSYETQLQGNSCVINKRLWIGNLFNFDEYVRKEGDAADPGFITLPQGYPFSAGE